MWIRFLCSLVCAGAMPMLLQVNCTLLAMDNHGVQAGSSLRALLDLTDVSFATFFATEMVLKMVAWGLWGCGKGYVAACSGQHSLQSQLAIPACNPTAVWAGSPLCPSPPQLPPAAFLSLSCVQCGSRFLQATYVPTPLCAPSPNSTINPRATPCERGTAHAGPTFEAAGIVWMPLLWLYPSWPLSCPSSACYGHSGPSVPCVCWCAPSECR